ncbi:MAG: ThuA domain-containing protein [Candidatus Aminicenantes bacterium]|nr:ThuA domain-containing protein [Candidatus Aminicenantes bacterium]
MKKLKSVSRRLALRTLSLGGAASALSAALPPSRTSSIPRKNDVFALIGDRWHNFDYIRTALARTLVKEAGASVVFTADHTLLTREMLAEHKLLLMLCDGLAFPGGYTSPYPFIDPEKIKIVSEPPLPALDESAVNWLTPEQGRAIREFVEKGGSAWFFHNASYISGGNADFRHVEGALFTGHTGFRPYKMKIENRDHPITKGVADFVVTEEQHFLLYDKDPKTVLVRSANEQGLEYSTAKYGNQGATCEACWAYDYGQGRVCFMAPGHTIPSFWNPEYVKLQKNALRWLLRET